MFGTYVLFTDNCMLFIWRMALGDNDIFLLDFHVTAYSFFGFIYNRFPMLIVDVGLLFVGLAYYGNVGKWNFVKY